MSSLKTIKLPASLGEGLDLNEINAQLRSRSAQLDWSDVIEPEEENLATLLAGLDLSDDADVLGIDGAIADSVAEAVSRFFEESKSRKVSPSKAAPKRSGKQPELWTSSTTGNGDEGQGEREETASASSATDD